MPYIIKKLSKPQKNSKGQLCSYGVYKKDGGQLVGKVKNHQEAIRYVAAIHANSNG